MVILTICRKNLNQSGCMDSKIITIEEEEFFIGQNAQIIVYALKFNRN
jgi:hypothetical protein